MTSGRWDWVARNVSVQVEGFKALSDATLAVPQGRITTSNGPDGAEKTTHSPTRASPARFNQAAFFESLATRQEPAEARVKVRSFARSYRPNIRTQFWQCPNRRASTHPAPAISGRTHDRTAGPRCIDPVLADSEFVTWQPTFATTDIPRIAGGNSGRRPSPKTYFPLELSFAGGSGFDGRLGAWSLRHRSVSRNVSDGLLYKRHERHLLNERKRVT